MLMKKRKKYLDVALFHYLWSNLERSQAWPKREDIQEAKKRLRYYSQSRKSPIFQSPGNDRQQMLTLYCIIFCHKQKLSQYRAWAVVLLFR